MKPISAFIISFFFFCLGNVAAQEEDPEILQEESAVISADSIQHKEKYGFRVGADLSKPIRTLFEDNYTGFEILGDYRLTKRIYIAAEIGNEQKTTFDDNITSKGKGSYLKLGFDYNMHNNWIGLNNMIHGGLRYGISSFSQELLEYTISTEAPFFPADNYTTSVIYNGLNAQWLELLIGVKAEVLNNLYLSINLQLKRRLNEKSPDNFENLYIPGFNRTYEDSKTGVGFGYTISYLIPIYKK